MGAVAGSPIYYNEHMRQLLQLIRVVITNANGRTVIDVSEVTGVKPEYVDIILRLASEIGMVEEEDGRFYVSEEARNVYDSLLTEVIGSIPDEPYGSGSSFYFSVSN
jgi:predicted transcriptional regulator of viral defense system